MWVMGTTENAIDDAIRTHGAAQDWGGVISGWVVIATIADHDGQDDTSAVRTVTPGGMGWPLVLGSIEAARIVLHKKWAE
jgi:hypothetical protein